VYINWSGSTNSTIKQEGKEMSKKMRRMISFMMVFVMMFSVLGMNVAASEVTTEAETETGSVYEKTNAYALNYRGNYGPYIYEYGSNYVPLISYSQISDEPYLDWIGTSLLYNVEDPDNDIVSTYCVDQYTGVPGSSVLYKRMNLEDSTFFSDEQAARLRSIYLKGFPHVALEELSAITGVENLQLSEAVSATQLAIWHASYGDDFAVHNFVHEIYAWYSKNIYKKYVQYYDDCYAEYDTNEDTEVRAERIEKVYDYLMNLEPTSPQAVIVSEASFIEWSKSPVLTSNEDGTYDVTMSATVNVSKNSGDVLTLSAVMGNNFTSINLENGKQTVDLTIENVPANIAHGEAILAIDGKQRAADVFIYVLEGGRDAGQERIGYSDFTLPVHAEVKVGPERVINFYKVDRIAIGNEQYKDIPLEGIMFDLYFVASWEDYVNGKITLKSREEVVADGITYDEYGFPEFTVTTDSSGTATVNLTENNLSDGVYLVVERDHAAIEEPVAPFYVLLPYTNAAGNGWEYVVNVNPKNDVKDDVQIEKDVIKLDNDEATVDQYKDHTWIIGTTIPVDIANGKEFIISDTLDNRLDYIGNVKVQVEYDGVSDAEVETPEPVVLVEKEDYILTVVNNDSLKEGKPSDSFTVALTAAGMKKVGAAVGSDYENYMIRVYFDAQINANAQLGVEIPNKAHLDYKNSLGVEFDKDSDIPKVYTGGTNLLKVDAKDETVVLSGAVFELYRPATENEINDVNVTKITLEGVDAQLVPVEFFGQVPVNGTEEKVTSVTSGEDGKIVIHGLAYGTYYLVETKAPVGYNLLSAPTAITIDADSHLEDNVVKILNNSGTQLPETGGMGTVLFTTVGLILVLGAGVLLVTRRRMSM